MAEGNFIGAADNAFSHLLPLWVNGTLKARLGQFWQSVIKPPTDVFPEDGIKNHPVSNWCTLIAATADQMHPSLPVVTTGADVPYSSYTTAASLVYRLCWLAEELTEIGNQITVPQQTALLAAYNAAFT